MYRVLNYAYGSHLAQLRCRLIFVHATCMVYGQATTSFFKTHISSLFILQTAPFSAANRGVYWLRAHALGAERDIELKISNKTFEQKGAKITFHIYNDSCLQMIEMGWWNNFEIYHGLIEGIGGWESYYFIR